MTYLAILLQKTTIKNRLLSDTLTYRVISGL